MSHSSSHSPPAEPEANSLHERNLALDLAECNNHLNLGAFAAALQALDRAVSRAPTNADILNHRGRLRWIMKMPEAAQADYQSATILVPDHSQANAGLARCHFQHGNKSEAERCAKIALSGDSQNAEAAQVLEAIKKQVGKESTIARRQLHNFFDQAHSQLEQSEPPQLSTWHLANSKVVPSRESILRLLPRGGICAEVGTQTGGFAREIMSSLQPIKLHLFDLDFTPFDHLGFDPLLKSGVVELHKGESSICLAAFPDQTFDFIYVDGDHSYAGVVKDLEVAKAKIKPDGWIVCNDYTLYSPVEKICYGVYRAVNELCWKDGFEIVYLGLHPWGYHDVALRRMPPEQAFKAGPPPPRVGGVNPAFHILTDPATDQTGLNHPISDRESKTDLIRNDKRPAECTPEHGLKLEMGLHTYVHDRKIKNPSGALTKITIGNFCSIATGLSIIGYDHHAEWVAMYPFLDDGHRLNWPGTQGIPYPQAPELGSNKSRGDIHIGHDVWIGCDVKLFKGITIGDGAVIGACSLVNKSVEAYTIVAGVPARPIRKRFTDKEIEFLKKIQWWHWPEPLINRHMGLLCSSKISELEKALAGDADFQNLELRRSEQTI